jgi:hypothetical protein
MATKKPAKKAAKKNKPARKAAAGMRKPAKKSVGGGAGGSGGGGTGFQKNPFPVATGKGASAAQIGADLVALFNAGKLREIEDKWWAPSITSVEGVGVNLGWAGRKAVEAKNKGWTEQHTMHGGSAEGPYLGSSGFAVKFTMEVGEKATGKRTLMEEIGVYSIKDGKIVREEFMYGRSTPIETPAGVEASDGQRLAEG